jgi:penicillin-binding protein 1A
MATGPEGAVVVIDPTTRKVLAMVGGFDTRIGDFNRASQGRRQPGSSFKPFVFAAAVDGGQFTAASVVNDAPEVYDLWKPENYKKGHFEGPVRLRPALARSINTVAIRVMHDVGPAKVVELAHAMGIGSELPPTLSLALGSGEVSPLELTNAFATFAAGGRFAPPRLVDAIDGTAVPDADKTQALRPEVAYVVTDMMRSVVDEGTATSARELKLIVAGKTGTSNDARDAWFIGMTPTVVVGVWVGFDAPRPLGTGETGGKAAVPVFVGTVKAMGRRVRSKPFDRPAGVVEARIDKRTGLLAAPGAPDEQSMVEVFVDGTAPTETATAIGEVDPTNFVTEQYDEEAGAGAGEAGAAPTP